MTYLLFIAAVFIVAGLAFYAGSLLYKLKAQNQKKQKTTKLRIKKITDSIETIALAIEQQQCNLSEGCIRLIHLLECLPITNKPDYSQQYPGLYELFSAVEHLPTHEARNAQSNKETRQQDKYRDEIELKFTSKILAEVSVLKTFSVKTLSPN